MRLRGYLSILMAALLLACKPTAQATTQSPSEIEHASEHAYEPSAKDSEDKVSEEIKKRAPKGLTQKYLDCMDQAMGTVERGACITDEKYRQDMRLNNNYKQLLNLLDKERRDFLVSAQREWLVLQEKDGAFESSLFGNTQPENISGAEREVFYMAERADRIQEWLVMVKID